MCFNSNQGIVIEFSENSGLIKCSQNPQLFFLMSEVLEKKKLELNEKVDFSVVPVSEDEKGFVRQSAGAPGESSDFPRPESTVVVFHLQSYGVVFFPA